MLTGSYNSSRQHIVLLTLPTGRYYCTVHKLVANAFLGPRPLGMQVNHKDGNRKNNRLSNLEYLTCSDNMKHAFSTGLAKPRLGEEHHGAKLTEEDVVRIRKRCAAGESQMAVARDYRLNHVTIHNIMHRKSWKHVA